MEGGDGWVYGYGIEKRTGVFAGTVVGESTRNGVIQVTYKGIRAQALKRMFTKKSPRIILWKLSGRCRLNYHLGELVASDAHPLIFWESVRLF